MKFKLLSIFPNILDSYLDDSIIKRAIDYKIIDVTKFNLRDWTHDRHRTVDDTPYGGGAGMLMKIEPLYQALKDIKKKSKASPKKRKVVLLSASGKTWNQKLARQYTKLDEIIFICGRYEGVDARIKKFIDTEISIGDYVLTGGELPAMIIIDSITRLLPGVLGNSASIEEESHSETNILEYPQYTRPAVFEAEGKKYAVPKILLEGHHAKIKDWRNKKQKTKK
ncbi:MAG: tRNA (guanosine(37)-N1)-methyltransferase TrmD [Patescibacteria group bacterium]|nr:tRNA (guanosine(37)-N1)-methyltransferase TrmD [Patescibacteria group bacterium]